MSLYKSNPNLMSLPMPADHTTPTAKTVPVSTTAIAITMIVTRVKIHAMTTSTIDRLGLTIETTIETTTVCTGTLAPMTGTTWRHENLATHFRGLTDAHLNVNILIDDPSVDTLIVVRRIADIQTVVPPTINTLKVDPPTTTPRSAKLSAFHK